MEDGIVTVFATIASASVAFAIILSLGKKYHDEDQVKNNDSLSKC